MRFSEPLRNSRPIISIAPSARLDSRNRPMLLCPSPNLERAWGLAALREKVPPDFLSIGSGAQVHQK